MNAAPRFTSRLKVSRRPDGRWVLLQDLVYRGSMGTFRVPRGFDTDFASVPRVPIAFWLTGDTAQEAAVVHDWLYRTQPISRAAADFVLFEASGAGEVKEPLWRRVLLWVGVWAFGWITWRRRRLDFSNHE